MNNWFDYDLAVKNYDSEWLELSEIFRKISLNLLDDRNVTYKYLDNPAYKRVYCDRDSSCFERAKMYEALAYGDSGVLLSSPGPALSGILLRYLGTEKQKDIFFNYLEQNKSRSFMALTEPEAGTDVLGMVSKFDLQSRKLYADKWLVNNSRDAEIGTILIKNSNKMYDITAILLTPEILSCSNVYRETLPVTGLHGAGLGRLVFDGTDIPENHILGADSKPSAKGFLGLMKTFYNMRPCVSALALGTAQAMLDFVKINLSSKESHYLHSELQLRLNAARDLNLYAAKMMDIDDLNASDVSIAKYNATKIAETIVSAMPDLVEKDIYINNIWLNKIMKDTYGFEWMEGSSDAQMFQVLQGKVKHRR